jgi:hypothetical protein
MVSDTLIVIGRRGLDRPHRTTTDASGHFNVCFPGGSFSISHDSRHVGGAAIRLTQRNLTDTSADKVLNRCPVVSFC